MTPKELAKTRDAEISEMFMAHGKRLEKIASDTLPHERAVQLLLEAGAQTPRILACSNLTLWRCVQISLELALPIGGASGQLWVLPFNNSKLGYVEAVPVIGYRGYVTLLGRSGITIKTRLHYDGEAWEWLEGTEQKLIHRPDDAVRDRVIRELADRATEQNIELEMNKLCRHAYSIARTPSGLTTFEVMSRAEIDTAEAMSPGKNAADSPWRNPLFWPRMVRKTVLTRHCKEQPIGDSKQVMMATEIDKHLEAGGSVSSLGDALFDDTPEGIQDDGE